MRRGYRNRWARDNDPTGLVTFNGTLHFSVDTIVQARLTALAKQYGTSNAETIKLLQTHNFTR